MLITGCNNHHFLTTYTNFSKHNTKTLCSSTNVPKKPTRRKSSSYGSSRKSVLRKTFKQEQVNFTAPISDDPLVAIIGGGMSGLLCALQLEKRGVRSTVFDTVCADYVFSVSFFEFWVYKSVMHFVEQLVCMVVVVLNSTKVMLIFFYM